VTSIEDDADGVRVMLDAGSRTETVTAGYLLGAGGGHSITRHSMHEHLAGETYDGRYFVVDAKIRLPSAPEYGRRIVGPTGWAALPTATARLSLLWENPGESNCED
jgi:2-polyprenyl-6-methoxyphenol hydroxylase-like FAD-dependent oxidoreductase